MSLKVIDRDMQGVPNMFGGIFFLWCSLQYGAAISDI